MSFLTKLLALKQAAAGKATTAPANGEGFVYWSPDTGEEYGRNHPVDSGEVSDATNIRHSTEMEDALNAGLQYWYRLSQNMTTQVAQLRDQRDTARAEAEANKADAQRLSGAFGIVAKVMNRMSPDYGFPASEMADDLDMQKADVLAVLRFLQSAGLAKRHPFFSEGDNKIQGSGYSLTAAGYSLAIMMPPHADHAQQQAA